MTDWWVCRRLEETEKAVDEVRDKIDQQNSQLGDLESEINMLKRRIESLTADRDKDKRRIAQLQDSLNRARIVSITPSNFQNSLLFDSLDSLEIRAAHELGDTACFLE